MSRRSITLCPLLALCGALIATALPANVAAQAYNLFPDTRQAPRRDVQWQPTLIPGTCVRPVYPLNAIRQKEQGRTALTLTVGPDGNVRRTSVSYSSGSARLDLAAQDAMSTCRFQPAHDSTGSPMQSSYSMHYDWRLEDAPPDPWVELKALGGAGFPATGDVATVAFTGNSVASPAQRAKVLAMVKARATEMAACPSIETAASRIVRDISATAAAGRRSIELWTLAQCGRTMRYVVLMAFPLDAPAFFHAVPLAASEPDPT